MDQVLSKAIRSKSQIAYSYETIKITKSRIAKGLIAIPVGLAGWFPDHNETVQIYLNDSPSSQIKNYSSYNSSTRECRIGGMRQWFQQNNIKSGDEIVLQLIDKEHFIYGLIPERNFVQQTKELEYGFDKSGTEEEASEKIESLVQWTHLHKDKIMFNEYGRLIGLPAEERQHVQKRSSRVTESVPPNIRILLEHIYKGHCQICDFWFLKRDKKPYFEIHHLYPFRGHHPQNILVVCGNCHNQFEYANVRQTFNEDKWLVRISFNEKPYSVTQVVLSKKREDNYKELFI